MFQICPKISSLVQVDTLGFGAAHFYIAYMGDSFLQKRLLAIEKSVTLVKNVGDWIIYAFKNKHSQAQNNCDLRLSEYYWLFEDKS